jgi:GNAT superfamily N-acetyltransferase
MADVQNRELEERDLPFLRTMLLTAALWRPWLRPLRLAGPLLLRSSELLLYHRDWGRPGDAGYVAERGDRRLGAVFYRLFTEEEHGDGYIDPETPELAIAVVPRARGSGLGTRLMEAMHEHGRREGLARIALSVDAGNPARRLYERLGYRDYEPGDGKGRMVLELRSDASVARLN